MRVGVLGTGMIGHMVVRELVKNPLIARVVAFDAVENSLTRCLDDISSDKVSGEVADLSHIEGVVKALQGVDLAIGCLPYQLSLMATEAAIAADCHYFDLCGVKFPEKQELNQLAKDKGLLVIPGCGVAPGLSNVLAARGVELLDEADEAVIYCGGIPRHPLPPLWYQIVFRLESVMGLYTRPALSVENHEAVDLPAMSGFETITFPDPVGECEAVITDAHSIAYTLKDKVNRLYEKTLRYKGHFGKMGTLAELGFLNDTPVPVDGVAVSPLKLSMALLGPKMKGASQEDILVMRVVVSGKAQGASVTHVWEMMDFFDEAKGDTAMARTTGFPPVILADWFANGKLNERGVLGIEEIVIGDKFKSFVEELSEKGVKIDYYRE